MKQVIYLTFTLITLIKFCTANTESVYNQHNLKVKLNIQESFIDVVDSIKLSHSEMNVFYLNSNLSIYESSCELKVIGSEYNYNKYKLPANLNSDYIVLKYKGIIADNRDGIQHMTHATMYESTNGIIFEKGIYLAGQTYWVPDFELADLKTFTIDIEIAKGWLLTSQGNIISEEIKDSTIYYSFRMDQPTNQVCLIGNRWTKYTETINNIDINVYLINEDKVLAQRYLDASSDYLNLYNNLIGEFPYLKFDVIENFWETGYGMPSFTLLGKRVMRFPWIIDTSYPHELLHNYWGNSVYVDYNKGNWCEGITTYMADHLLKEKDGDGHVFRRAQLKKYTDYVNSENDFPPSQFKSKHDAASEAIGYSKVLMANHMLRIKYGTDIFLKSYANFYQNHKFKIASFNDIENSFEKATGENLDNFFNQWINSEGAPTINLNRVKVKRKKEIYTLNFEIAQSYQNKPYELDIPVYVYLKNNMTVERKALSLSEPDHSYSFNFTDKPVRIDIDPLFDVMRKLNRDEVPPTLSQILGSNKWTIILPKSSKAYFHYKNLAISWSRIYSERGIEIKMVNDNKIEKIPTDCSVWILGAENNFARYLNVREKYNSVESEEILSKIDSLNKNELIVFTIPNPENEDETIGYINSNNPSIIGQLNMKLMHYSNFSYVGFEGKSLKNTLKGNFPVLNSSLKYIIDDKESINWSEYNFPINDIMYK